MYAPGPMLSPFHPVPVDKGYPVVDGGGGGGSEMDSTVIESSDSDELSTDNEHLESDR